MDINVKPLLVASLPLLLPPLLPPLPSNADTYITTVAYTQ